MFPVILNHLDDDDDNLINEANNYDYSGYSDTSPLYQDNLRCTISRRLARRFSANSSNRNQLIQPGERIIEIKSESDDEQPQTSTSINEHTSLINDYRFQRYRPIRTQDHNQLDNQDQHSQVRMKRNYQILRSKKRFTFPICFFVGLYISFLLMSSMIFTMFEQKMGDTNSYFNLQKQLMSTLTIEQFELIENLIDQSIQIQKSGIDVMNVLYDNKFLINQLILKEKSNNKLNTIDQTTNLPFINSTIQNINDDKLDFFSSNQLRSRKTYNWDFQQALFYVVSIATTIGYGNLTPESNNGKIYTIIFGLIAIPYTTILFSIVVSKFSNGPLRRFKLRLLTKHFTEKSHESLRIIRFICFILTTIFILICIMGIPAALFNRMEKHWTYLDGFYFIFISITTTGLGDFVPEFVGSLHHWIYEIGVIVFLYFGIIMIMLWMTLIKSVFRRTISIKLDEYDQTDEEDRHEQVLEEQVLINYDYHQKNYINYGSFYGYDEVNIRVPKDNNS